MKGMLKGVAALALATVFAASSVQAQAKFGVAGTGLESLKSGLPDVRIFSSKPPVLCVR